MRFPLLALAALLAACQADQPGNEELTTLERNLANLEVASNSLSAASGTGGPDTPVSSDNPQPPQSPDPGPTPDCPIIRATDWQAHVDAMPGPSDNPRLIVGGKITVPTGGYKLGLRLGAVAESYPVQVTIYLDAVPPSGPATQAIETREVRGSWRSEERVGSVTVRCASRVLARLSDIETSH
jgi:hypothetical protein